MVTNTCQRSTAEARQEGLQGLGQLGLYSETLPLKKRGGGEEGMKDK